jgi:hypothetical protein
MMVGEVSRFSSHFLHQVSQLMLPQCAKIFPNFAMQACNNDFLLENNQKCPFSLRIWLLSLLIPQYVIAEIILKLRNIL